MFSSSNINGEEAEVTILSGDSWQRYGRGKIVQFFATDEEVCEFLEECLPREFAPYSLLWVRFIEDGNKYRHEYVASDLGDFLELRAQGVWKFFLRSKVLTPGAFPESTAPVDWSWSFSGLVNIQQGRLRQGRQEWSGLGIVDKAQNKETGEIVSHEGYLKIFNVLKKSLRKRLLYNTVKARPNGTLDESKSIRMTEGYAEWCRSNPEKSTVMVGAPGK